MGNFFRYCIVFFSMSIVMIASGQELVINEVGTGDNGDTFVELLVVGDPCDFHDIRGWIIDDNNGDFISSCPGNALAGTGVSTGFIKFSDDELWADIPSGTMIVLRDDSYPDIPEILFCDDFLIEMRMSQEDYFIENLDSPVSSNAGLACENRSCGTANGSNSYPNGPFTTVSNDPLSSLFAGALVFNMDRDALQVRDASANYFHGISWGVAEDMGCSMPAASNISDGIHFSSGGNYQLVNSIDNDYRDQNNWRSNQSQSPGEANTRNNANWIIAMRFPLEDQIIDNNCNSPLDQIEICVGETYTFELTGCDLNEYDWLESSSSFDITFISDTEIEITGLSPGDGNISLEIYNEYDNFSPGNNHNSLQEFYEIPVSVTGFNASFGILDGTEICVGDCRRVSLEAPSGTYDVGFEFDGNSEFINNISNNQILTICLDDMTASYNFNSATNTINIPVAEVGNTMDLVMDFIEEDGGCEGVADMDPISFDLVGGVAVNIPTELTACVSSGNQATFDLTSKENEISTSGIFTWSFSNASSNPPAISNPIAFNSSSSTVYAQVTEGNCKSPFVPLDLTVIPATSETFSIAVTPITECLLPGDTRDITFTIGATDPTVEYNIMYECVKDGVLEMSSVTFIDNGSVVIPNVLDMVSINILDATVSGTCPQVNYTPVFNTVSLSHFPDLSMIADATVCDTFFLQDLVMGLDSVFYQDTLSGTELFTPDTLMQSTVIRTIGWSDGCADTVFQSIVINPSAQAGEGTSQNLCLDRNQDSLALFSFLTGNVDSGGFFTIVPDPDVMVNELGKIAISDMGLPPYSILYKVESAMCADDSTLLILDYNLLPYAGEDSMDIVMPAVVDLYAYFRNRDMDGQLYDGNFMPILSPFDLTGQSSPLDFYHIVSNTCGNDTALLILELQTCPIAGLDSTLIDCGDITFIPQDLSRGSVSVHYEISGDTIPGDAIIILPEGNEIVIQVVADTMMGCAADTALLQVRSVQIPNAGLDTLFSICDNMLDLTSLVRNTSITGTFQDEAGNNIVIPQSVDLSMANPGFNTFYHIVGAGACGFDTAAYTIDLTYQRSSGLDTVWANCGLGFFIPEDYLRQGDTGVFYLENRIIPGDTSLVFQGQVDAEVKHVIPSIGSCMADTAYYLIVNERTPFAGEDVDTFVCTSGIIDLRDFLLGADSNGYFEDFSGNVLSSSEVTIEVGDEFLYRYVSEAGFCGTDNAVYRFRNYDLTGSNLSPRQIDICEDDCFMIYYPLPFDGYEVHFSLTNTISGETYSGSESVLMNDSIEICYTIDGMEDVQNLDGEGSYIFNVDSINYPGVCVQYPEWRAEIKTIRIPEEIVELVMCSGDSLVVGDSVFTELNTEGTIILEGSASNGCDSIVHVRLTYENYRYGQYVDIICSEETIVINGKEYGPNKLFGMDTLIGDAAGGCDSILTVSLVHLDRVISFVRDTFCDISGNVIVEGVSYNYDNQSGTEIVENGNVNGCDSVIEVKLTYLEPSVFNFDTMVCDRTYEALLGGELYNVDRISGTTVMSGAAINGCDSIIEVSIQFGELFYSYQLLPPLCPEDSMGSIQIDRIDGPLPATLYVNEEEVEIIAELPYSYALPVNTPTLIEVISSDNCSGTQIISVEAQEPLQYSILSKETGSNEYLLTIDTEDEIVLYNWYPHDDLSCIDCAEPEVLLTANRTVFLEGETDDGCLILDSIRLSIDLKEVIYVSNIFSPNGDGNNDNWTVYTRQNVNIDIRSIVVYDRLGNKIIDLPLSAINNPSEGWGREAMQHSEGVYVYRIEYENESGEIEFILGDLTLIR